MESLRERLYRILRAIRSTPEPTSGVVVGQLSYNETVAYDAIVGLLGEEAGAPSQEKPGPAGPLAGESESNTAERCGRCGCPNPLYRDWCRCGCRIHFDARLHPEPGEAAKADAVGREP